LFLATGMADAADRPVVDWVVRMARVPDADFLDARAARDGELDDDLLTALGDAVAAYHDGLTSLTEVDAAAAMAKAVVGNADSAMAAGLPKTAVREWCRNVQAALRGIGGWQSARRKAGFVRRAHGDLHLGNLCLWRGRPALFDALEFDEDLARIDVAYDLAFLVMDLDRRVGRAAANQLLNRYVARTGDAGLVGGLPPFLSLRAMIRAHVAARRGMADEAQDYLAAAGSYLTPPLPTLVGIGGLQGAGKSTIARALAPTLGSAPGALVLRSDVIRKRIFGHAPEQRLPPVAYAEGVGRRVFAALNDAARMALVGGHAVVADATFLGAADRAALASVAHDAGARFLGFWLHAPLPVLEARVAGRRGDASDATVAVLRATHAAHPRPPAGWTPIDAIDADAALARVRAILA
jgi:predicted kinase